MAAVAPSVESLVDFVGLVDGVDCLLDVPETVGEMLVFGIGKGRGKGGGRGGERVEKGCVDLLVDRNILADATEFSLKADTRWVERTRLDRVERRTALRVGVVVIVLDIA